MVNLEIHIDPIIAISKYPYKFVQTSQRHFKPDRHYYYIKIVQTESLLTSCRHYARLFCLNNFHTVLEIYVCTTMMHFFVYKFLFVEYQWLSSIKISEPVFFHTNFFFSCWLFKYFSRFDFGKNFGIVIVQMSWTKNIRFHVSLIVNSK